MDTHGDTVESARDLLERFKQVFFDDSADVAACASALKQLKVCDHLLVPQPCHLLEPRFPAGCRGEAPIPKAVADTERQPVGANDSKYVLNGFEIVRLSRAVLAVLLQGRRTNLLHS